MISCLYNRPLRNLLTIRQKQMSSTDHTTSTTTTTGTDAAKQFWKNKDSNSNSKTPSTATRGKTWKTKVQTTSEASTSQQTDQAVKTKLKPRLESVERHFFVDERNGAGKGAFMCIKYRLDRTKNTIVYGAVINNNKLPLPKSETRKLAPEEVKNLQESTKITTVPKKDLRETANSRFAKKPVVVKFVDNYKTIDELHHAIRNLLPKYGVASKLPSKITSELQPVTQS